MKSVKLLLLPALLLALPCAFATESVFWLRGDDAKTYIDNNIYFLMSTGAPTSSSHATTISEDAAEGRGELARWYSLPFPSRQVMKGGVYLWFKNLPRNNDILLRFVLYDFHGSRAEGITASGWQNADRSNLTLSSEITAPYTLQAGHSLRLVLEYTAEKATKFSFLTDAPDGTPLYTWRTPTGSEYYLTGVKNTAALLFTSCHEIMCSSDSGCDDNDVTTTDMCLNPGSCSAACLNDACPVECRNDSDCDDNNPLTLDTCAGKGTCETSCTSTACDVECSAAADCTTKEGGYCSYGGTCFSNCVYSECSGEKKAAQECFIAVCSDGVWEQQPPAECCGDAVCSYSEQSSCPQDCTSGITITLADEKEGSYFLRDERIVMSMSLLSNGTALKGASARAAYAGTETVFVETDGIYEASLTVPQSADGGLDITITADYMGLEAEVRKPYVIVPRLGVEASLDKENYIAGDEIVVRGTVTRRGSPAEAQVTASFLCSGVASYTEEKESSTSGFTFRHITTGLVSCRPALLRLTALDSAGNRGSLEKEIPVESPEVAEPLLIEVSGLKQSYRTGAIMSFGATLSGPDGNAVEGAVVELEIAGRTFILMEKGAGDYEAAIAIPFDAGVGEHELLFRAIRIDGIVLRGEAKEKVLFTSSGINVEILGAEQTGPETTAVEFSLFYPDAEPLGEAYVEFFVGTEKQQVWKKGENLYFVTFRGTEFTGVEISVRAEDLYGNETLHEREISVRRMPVVYYLRQHLAEIALILLGIAAAFFFLYTRRSKVRRLKELEQRKKHLTTAIEGLQKRYFVDGTIKRELYYMRINQYNTELKEAKKQLRELKES
jgi:hypothetical protein